MEQKKSVKKVADAPAAWEPGVKLPQRVVNRRPLRVPGFPSSQKPGDCIMLSSDDEDEPRVVKMIPKTITLSDEEDEVRVVQVIPVSKAKKPKNKMSNGKENK
ncbi:hypothetical protein CRE_04255 [Caenorhabditis remanei]|uniref:Uncharacterized protein n=1 Tax=Caenorhabditis remanei TaxID=31234 RepID=E3N678_CAERE|nr:hypothetical protein CRE_04255 [Caenorhabditis remanei]